MTHSAWDMKLKSSQPEMVSLPEVQNVWNRSICRFGDPILACRKKTDALPDARPVAHPVELMFRLV